jgi:pseudoazurin
MLNRGAEGVMIFEPALAKIAPGDIVKFVATDKGHNAKTIKGMLPADAAPLAGKSGERAIPRTGKAKQVMAGLFDKRAAQTAAK